MPQMTDISANRTSGPTAHGQPRARASSAIFPEVPWIGFPEPTVRPGRPAIGNAAGRYWGIYTAGRRFDVGVCARQTIGGRVVRPMRIALYSHPAFIELDLLARELSRTAEVHLPARGGAGGVANRGLRVGARRWRQASIRPLNPRSLLPGCGSSVLAEPASFSLVVHSHGRAVHQDHCG
jgi:hypothetical protein